MKRMWYKFSRGSILAYSLILLGIVLTATIGMMSASVTNLKSSSSSDKSSNAFQIADSGSQAVLKMLKNTSESNLSGVVINDAGGTCPGEQDAAVESSGSFLGGGYKVIFQDSNGQTLKCNAKVSDVASIKSVGSYAETARAVETAVAATTASGGLSCYEHARYAQYIICCKDGGSRPSCQFGDFGSNAVASTSITWKTYSNSGDTW